MTNNVEVIQGVCYNTDEIIFRRIYMSNNATIIALSDKGCVGKP